MAIGDIYPYRRSTLMRDPRFGTGSLLFDMQRQMNRIFEDVFDESPQGNRFGGTFPPLEVSQDDNRIEICAELPGVREEDVELSVEDGVLTLSGEKKSERKEGGYTERSFGRFERRISLPSNVDAERCQAEFRDGVLTVTIPKDAAKSRGRRIPLGGAARQQGGVSPEDSLIEQREGGEKPQG